MFVDANHTRHVRCCGPDSRGDNEGNCLGSACMAWRWEPLMTSPAWIEAVKKAAVEINDKSPGRIKAAEHVNANRVVYGLASKPFRGWCGLAGHPDQFT
jgi:hypothetical protein